MPTPRQLELLNNVVKARRTDVERWILGGARGIDTAAAQAVLSWTDALITVVYPDGFDWAEDAALGLSAAFPDRMDFRSAPGGYMARNDDLVAQSDRLLAFPSQPTEVPRSGTWATVRRARKRNVPVTLFIP